MVQFYYFCLYLGTEAAVSCRLMDGKDRHVLFSFFLIFNATPLEIQS